MRRFKRKEGLLKRVSKRLFRKDLLKNKVYSIILMLLGYLSLRILDGDGTVYIFTLMLGLPIFFAKENVIEY